MVSQIRSSRVNVIVTGASGQLGRLVIEELAAVPTGEVTAVVRDPAKAGRPATPVADAIAAALAG
jgi:uncharacterized protein YbjT (DUF2867 family)